MARRELAGGPSMARHQMWRAIRMMRAEGFAVSDLISLCGVRRKAAEKFLLPLVRSGYLAASGGGPARRYVLIRDTGPIAPRVSHRGDRVVLDLNEEIARERHAYAALLDEIRRSEGRLRRLGAYVQRFQAPAPNLVNFATALPKLTVRKRIEGRV